MTEVGMRTCPDCGITKPRSDYHHNSQRKDGIGCYCKPCTMARINAYTAKRGNGWKAHKRIKDRERYLANSEIVSQKCAEYYVKNRSEVMRRVNSWAARNPEKRRAISQSYKHRRRATEKTGVSTGDFVAWKRKQPKVCYWCGARCPRKYEVDHYDPLAKGGKHEIPNLVISCRPCNAKKSAKDPIEFANSVGRLF